MSMEEYRKDYYRYQEELEALHDALVKQKKALMDALKVYNDVNYRINKLRSKIKKQIKNKEL